jgi:hypothetical protein
LWQVAQPESKPNQKSDPKHNAKDVDVARKTVAHPHKESKQNSKRINLKSQRQKTENLPICFSNTSKKNPRFFAKQPPNDNYQNKKAITKFNKKRNSQKGQK